jgi:hypothetical protein
MRGRGVVQRECWGRLDRRVLGVYEAGRQAVPGGRFSVGVSRGGGRKSDRLGGRILVTGLPDPTHVFPAFSRPQPNIRNIIGRCVGIWKMAWEWPATCLRDSLAHPAARFERSVEGEPQDGSVSGSAAAHRPRAARDMRGPRRASEPMR